MYAACDSVQAQVELPWQRDTTTFPVTPMEDAVDVSKALSEKYGHATAAGFPGNDTAAAFNSLCTAAIIAFKRRRTPPWCVADLVISSNEVTVIRWDDVKGHSHNEEHIPRGAYPTRICERATANPKILVAHHTAPIG
eukprot:1194413-Prorocentrum_minimum.AAC.1